MHPDMEELPRRDAFGNSSGELRFRLNMHFVPLFLPLRHSLVPTDFTVSTALLSPNSCSGSAVSLKHLLSYLGMSAVPEHHTRS